MHLYIKKVKNKEYLQIIDINGYLHHIGPTNPENFALSFYIIGFHDYWRLAYWIRDYYMSKKKISEDYFKEIEKIISFYIKGANGDLIEDFGKYTSHDFEGMSNEFECKIELYKRLENDIINLLKEERIKANTSTIKKMTKKLYKDSSETQKLSWIEDIKREKNLG